MIHEFIIHWNLNSENNSTKLSNYVSKADEFIKEVTNTTRLQEVFKARVKKVYKINGDKKASKLLRAASLFNSKGFQNEVKKLFDQTALKVNMEQLTFRSQKNGGPTTNEINKAIKELDDHSTEIEKSFEKIANFFGVQNSKKDIDAFFKYIAATEKKTIIQEASNIVDTNTTGVTSVSLQRLQLLDGKALGALRSLANAKMMDPKSTSEAVQIYNRYNILFNTLAGQLFEISLANAETMITNRIKGALGKNARVEFSGAGENNTKLEYKTPTTDVKIHPDNNTASFSISLPVGISVKRVTPYSNGSGLKMSIKNSNLQKMLDITMARLDMPNSKQFKAMANIMFNAKKKNTKTEVKYNKWRELLFALNRTLAVTGLAGSLSEKDISTVFIVNNNIMNIYDILGEITNSDNYMSATLSGGVTKSKLEEYSEKYNVRSNDANSQTEQKERSQNILNHMDEIKINMKLFLSNAKIADLANKVK